MKKYADTWIFTHCPHCGTVLRLPVKASWQDFEPEVFSCRDCQKAIKLTASGKIEKGAAK